MQYITDRLRERSTWLGIGGIFAASHYWFTNIAFDAFITMMAAIVGFIATVVPDQRCKNGKCQ